MRDTSTLINGSNDERANRVQSSNSFGKPCVAATRIPIQSTLELVRERLGFDQIINELTAMR
jgi:uncharacterized protein (DUF433 family)